VTAPLLALLALTGMLDPNAGYAPAESAAVARTLWHDARQAGAAGDPAKARACVRRAHAAWPNQWVYAYGLASMAALAGDSTETARALDDLARIGAGPDLARDSGLVALAARSARVSAALSHVADNRKPVGRSELALTFAPTDTLFYPEGLALDPRDGAWFLTSVRQRKVAIVEPHQPPRDFATGLDAALAVAVDPVRNRVWVTSAALPQMEGYVSADSGRAAVDCFDRRTGRRLKHHPFPPAPEGHVPGDVVVTTEGDVYVSDSAHPAIYHVTEEMPDGTPAKEWMTDPGFRSLQGQALSSNGSVLFVADYSHGIAAIRRATREVTWLKPPAGQCTLGIDGLARHGRDLVGVQNGIDPPRVVRLRIDESGRDALGVSIFHLLTVDTLDRRIPLADEPTSLVVDGDAVVYVADSQWEKYDDAGHRKPGTRLAQPILLKVTLPHF